MQLENSELMDWIGKSQTSKDIISVKQARLAKVTFDQEPSIKDGDELPSLWHWMYFLSEIPRSRLGNDGHEKLGNFLPPVSLPRRQWAGGRFEFHKPLLIGSKATKKSTIKKIIPKEGRTGRLCFVTVLHEISSTEGLCFTEEHDIVYRENTKQKNIKKEPVKTPDNMDWSEEFTPDPTLLFRYSALTFNGHRIHYDRTYCIEEENYEGLIVHGPLIATLLLSKAIKNHPLIKPVGFEFKSIGSIMDTQSFTISGKKQNNKIDLFASTISGEVAMKAKLNFTP